jgi:hypothetical protein
MWMLHQCRDKIERNLGERHRISLGPKHEYTFAREIRACREDGNWMHGVTAVRKLEAYIFVDA